LNKWTCVYGFSPGAWPMIVFASARYCVSCCRAISTANVRKTRAWSGTPRSSPRQRQPARLVYAYAIIANVFNGPTSPSFWSVVRVARCITAVKRASISRGRRSIRDHVLAPRHNAPSIHRRRPSYCRPSSTPRVTATSRPDSTWH